MQGFLIRRFWLLRQRLISSTASALVLPIIVFLTLSIGMNNIFMETMGNISYKEWVYPGLIILINTIIITISITNSIGIQFLVSIAMCGLVTGAGGISLTQSGLSTGAWPGGLLLEPLAADLYTMSCSSSMARKSVP